jgi:Rrf2 family transcriptional regulator, nitric oxide-sensitive transcriptional repressor
MQLTRHTDYALRVLMYLAKQPDKLSSVSEVAAFYSVSRNHLVKVVQGLTESGFVKTTRGKHGGMQLAHDSKDISVGSVVRKMENHFNIVECFELSTDGCCIENSCGLKAVIHRATSHFLKELDKTSLADVL